MGILTIWFDNIERKKNLQDAIENSSIFGKINFSLLDDIERDDIETTKYNILNVPTSMKIITIEKGEWTMLIKGKNLPSVGKMRKLLWPKHHIYDVGPNVVSQVREAFMPGLTTIRCEKGDGGIKLIVNPIVSENTIDIIENIERILTENSIEYDDLIKISPFKKGGRSLLSSGLLKRINDSFECAGLKSPDFEWYPYPVGLYELVAKYDNVFALGQGNLPAATPLPSENPKDINNVSAEFQSFLAAFIGCV